MSDHYSLVERSDWMNDSACKDLDSDIFFPRRGQSAAAAKAVCAECPVRAHCLAYALTTGVKHGVWGGTSEQERRQIRRKRAADAGVPGIRGPLPGKAPIKHGTNTGYTAHPRQSETPCADCKAARALYQQAHRPSRAGPARRQGGLGVNDD